MTPDASNGPFGPIVNGTQIVFYEYRPNAPAAISFVVLFGLATLGHVVYLFWLRAWSFIPLIIGTIAEAFGYVGRFQSSHTPDKAGPFILQNLLILGAAPFIAATIYMTLSRIIISMEAQHHAVISTRWVTKIYILIDIGCITTQLIGSILPASGDPSSVELSRKILLGGLITQVVALTIFILSCSYAHHKITRDAHPPLVNPSINWQNHFRTLELVTVLLIVRSVVRATEFLQGEGGFVISHEAFIYALDGAPMLLVVLVFLVLHPTRLSRDIYKEKREQSSENYAMLLLQAGA